MDIFSVGVGHVFITGGILLGGAVVGGLLLLTFILYDSLLYQTRRRQIVLNSRRASRCFPVLGSGQVTVFSGRAKVVKSGRLLSVLLRGGFGMMTVFSPRRNFEKSTSTNRRISDSMSGGAKMPVLSLCSKGSKGPDRTSVHGFSVLIMSVRSMNLEFCACCTSVYQLVSTYTRCGHGILVLSHPGPGKRCISNPVLSVGCGSNMN